METRADADPLLTRMTLDESVELDLGGHSRSAPDVSPLYGDLATLPPVEIHVGDAEILLDDSVRYGERMTAAGGDVTVRMRAGLPHVFQPASEP